MPASVRSWASPNLSSTSPRPEYYCRYVARPGAAVNDGTALNPRRLAPRRPDQGQSRLRPAGISPHRRVEATYLASRIQRIGDACVRLGCDEVAVAYDLVFVPHPDPYSMFHNSNRVVAGWLEQLGCRVEGTTLLSVWQLGAD